MFYEESIIHYDDEKGIGETFFILCPVCWSYGIKITVWEDGSEEQGHCPVCSRKERTMEIEDLERLFKKQKED
jgi:hypothetical protein